MGEGQSCHLQWRHIREGLSEKRLFEQGPEEEKETRESLNLPGELMAARTPHFLNCRGAPVTPTWSTASKAPSATPGTQ